VSRDLLSSSAMSSRCARLTLRASAPGFVAACGKSPAPPGAACGRSIGHERGAPVRPAPARHASTPLRFVPASRARPIQTGGDPAAPGWHRARLNLAQPAALTLAARREGRRVRSLRSACGSRSFASATSRSAGSARPGARGARALARQAGRGAARGHQPSRPAKNACTDADGVAPL